MELTLAPLTPFCPLTYSLRDWPCPVGIRSDLVRVQEGAIGGGASPDSPPVRHAIACRLGSDYRPMVGIQLEGWGATAEV
jgi:hypothetical protein